MWGFKRKKKKKKWGRRERAGKREKLALFPDEGEAGWCFKVQPGKATSIYIYIYLRQYIEWNFSRKLPQRHKSQVRPQSRETGQIPSCYLKINKQNLKTGSSSFPIQPLPQQLHTHQLPVPTLRIKQGYNVALSLSFVGGKATGIKLWVKCPNMFFHVLRKQTKSNTNQETGKNVKIAQDKCCLSAV